MDLVMKISEMKVKETLNVIKRSFRVILGLTLFFIKEIIPLLFLLLIMLFVELNIVKYYFYGYFLLIINSYVLLLSILVVNTIIVLFTRLATLFIKPKLKRKTIGYDKLVNWVKCIKLYFVILILTCLLSHLLFIKFKLFHTNPDSARYLLSAVIQSQAAIIAIVVSLTLVAVQLAASSYSRRTVDVFKKNPDFWIVLSSYGISIVYSMIILKLIDKVDKNGYSDLEVFISLSSYFTIFTFIILFPFFINMLNILKPSTIIQELINDITKRYVIECKGDYGKKPNDPFYPIADIFKDSLLKRDFDITRELLTGIRSKARELTFPKEDKYILNYFYFHLRELADFVAQTKNDIILEEILVLLREISYRMEPNELNEDMRISMITCLKDVGQSAAKYGLGSATRKALKLIDHVGQNPPEAELQETKQNRRRIEAIGDIGYSACEGKLDIAVSESIWLLHGLGRRAAEEKLNNLILIIERIRHIYSEAVKQDELQYTTEQAIRALKEISIISAENGFEEPAFRSAEYFKLFRTKESEAILNEIAEALGGIGKATIENGYEKSTLEVIEALKFIVYTGADKGFTVAESASIRRLGEIGEIALEKRSELANDILASLKLIGYIEFDVKHETVLLDLIESLRKIGMIAAENGCKKSFMIVEKSLVGFGNHSIDKEFPAVFFKITDVLIELAKIAFRNELNDEFLQTRISLNSLMISALNKGFRVETCRVVYELSALGISFWNGNKLKETEEIINDIKTIGITAIKSNNGAIAIDAVISISIDLLWIAQHLNHGSTEAEREKAKTFFYTVNSLSHIGILAADNKLEDVATKVSFNLKEIIKSLNGKIGEESTKIIPMIVAIGVRSIKNDLDFVAETSALHLAELAELELFVFDDLMKELHSFYTAKGTMMDEFQRFKRLCTYYIDNIDYYQGMTSL